MATSASDEALIRTGVSALDPRMTACELQVETDIDNVEARLTGRLDAQNAFEPSRI